MAQIQLRKVDNRDLPIFFSQQLDPDAIHMAAFTTKDPSDLDAFNAHWQRILNDPKIIIRTIEKDDVVVGYVLSYPEDGRQEVSYWIGKEFWGQGITTSALRIFLEEVNRTRPIFARVAKDNIGSIRVLEKCMFNVIGDEIGFASGRNREIPELLLERVD